MKLYSEEDIKSVALHIYTTVWKQVHDIYEYQFKFAIHEDDELEVE